MRLSSCVERTKGCRVTQSRRPWDDRTVASHCSAPIAWWSSTRLYSRGAGLAPACLWSLLNPEPIFKYTEFTLAVVVPLYFHALHRFVARPTLPVAVYLGLMLAAAGYSHAVVFV